jgi:ADP-heptose:LPS heptosyltransferase
MAPRSKISTLWSYTKTLPQHRSRVEKSEMEYNVDLARALLDWAGLATPVFRGLPALKIPPTWTSPRVSPDLVVVVSNRGSAENWPLERYVKLGRDRLLKGERVDFLVNGIDAHERKEALLKSGVLSEGAGLVEGFSRLSELICYLAASREVVSSSTGPLHLAHAAGVPVLGIYPTLKLQSFDRWRPHGYWHSAALRFIEVESSSSLPGRK